MYTDKPMFLYAIKYRKTDGQIVVVYWYQAGQPAARLVPVWQSDRSRVCQLPPCPPSATTALPPVPARLLDRFSSRGHSSWGRTLHLPSPRRPRVGRAPVSSRPIGALFAGGSGSVGVTRYSRGRGSVSLISLRRQLRFWMLVGLAERWLGCA